MIQELKVDIVTGFVYVYQRDTFAAERGVYIVEGVTPHIGGTLCPLDMRLTFQRLEQVESLQEFLFFQHLLPKREEDQLALVMLYKKFA